MKKYFIKTFGCQMNYSDSERIAAVFEKQGFKPAPDIKNANVVVFNTCGVRQMAEDRVYGQIHNLRRLVRAGNRKALIAVTGCLADRKDVQKRLAEKVDIFFPVQDMKKFEKFLLQKLKGNSCKTNNPALPTEKSVSYLSIEPSHANSFSAFVPVMTGCNNFCAYCVVAYARGREKSRPADEIISEVRELVKKGYKMITLLGQNVNSYRPEKFSKKDRINFAKLLGRVDKIPGEFWISFLTSHPKDMSDELIETITKSKKIIEFVHLPIQAGDDKVLKEMNRKYTAKHYLGLVRKIKTAFKKHKPDMFNAITGDIIVGFPGETKKQFLESAKVMEKVKYDMIYFGQFSPRPGTVAAKMKDNVTHAEKERREKYLNEILKKTAFANSQKQLGKAVEVLVEKEEVGHYFGRTRTMKNIRIISAKKGLVGKIIKAKVDKASAWNLEGSPID